VTVPHRALEVVVPALGELFAITPDDRVLQFASLNWDTAFEEILPALAAGACVVFDADAHTGSLPRMLRMLERQRVTVLDLPTAFWHELVLHLGETGTGLPEPVRLVVIGGEAVDPTRLEAWRRLPGIDRIRLLNTYGATETTQITHAVDLEGPARDGRAPSYDAPPIGRPLAHVVQRTTEAGELLIGGPALASGYAGRPEATAERFVEIDGQAFFRTGDLVRESADGLVHHLGRLDAQVKVRGIRVDPGEVEAHLVRCPGVAAAAVTGAVVSGRTVLAAYVVPATPPGNEPGGPAQRAGRASSTSDERTFAAGIRAFIREHAPAHLHPARITVVPRLVHTASGKVDRRATHARYRAAPTPAPTPRPLAQEATS
jgi:acyl-coenzyme A synthetase/AMP-(fatty) acid ligase